MSRQQARWMALNLRNVRLLAWVLLAGLLLWRTASAWTVNIGYTSLINAAFISSHYANSARPRLERSARFRPSSQWALALLDRWQGEDERMMARLHTLIDANTPPISLLRALEPGNIELALYTWERHPDKALAAFWYGESIAEIDSSSAIVAYEAALALNPSVGERWVQLGDFYRDVGDNEQALRAFDMGCRIRDRGRNGCMRAGAMAEALGRIDDALMYYRMSLLQLPGWAPALARIDALSQ